LKSQISITADHQSGLKSRIFITAGHRPAERTRTPHDCLKGRTPNTGIRPAIQAETLERPPVRRSKTRGYENHALRAAEANLPIRSHSCPFTRIPFINNS
jgi:hypothetical protein